MTSYSHVLGEVILVSKSSPGQKSGDGAAVRKVCAVLRALGSGRERRLTQIAEAAELNKATALRILRHLVEEEFVARSGDGRRYRLGREPAILATMFGGMFRDLRDLIRMRLERITADSGGAVLINMLAGHDVVCVEKMRGSFPIPAHALQTGTRVPLGANAAGVVILAAMPSQQAESLLDAVEHLLAPPTRETRHKIEADIAVARQGYFLAQTGKINGMVELAAPILLAPGQPVGGLTLLAPQDRVVDRLATLVELLTSEARHISEMSAAHAVARTNPAN